MAEDRAVLRRLVDVPSQGRGRLGEQLSLGDLHELQQAKIGHPAFLKLEQVSGCLQALFEVES